jgi:serine-type D-Ala-D-Ala carboxypeptidase (penicillin-binding protein 5/6)
LKKWLIYILFLSLLMCSFSFASAETSTVNVLKPKKLVQIKNAKRTTAVKSIKKSMPILPKNMKNLKLDSKSAILINLKTGKIIYGKNISQKHYPASTTKILTAIIALEKGKLSKTVVIGQRATLEEPSKINLKKGEKMKLKDLLYATLVYSANDAAEAVAEYIGGTRIGFAKLMNRKAKLLGCINSNFVNPNGLPDKNHYTTAYDLALISRYAMKNPVFRSIVATKAYKINATNKSSSRSIIGHNKMLEKSQYYYPGCTGVKTGYTLAANHTLVSSATRGNKQLLAVILDDTAVPYNDIIKMFNYGFSLK